MKGPQPRLLPVTTCPFYPKSRVGVYAELWVCQCLEAVAVFGASAAKEVFLATRANHLQIHDDMAPTALARMSRRLLRIVSFCESLCHARVQNFDLSLLVLYTS